MPPASMGSAWHGHEKFDVELLATTVAAIVAHHVLGRRWARAGGADTSVINYARTWRHGASSVGQDDHAAKAHRGNFNNIDVANDRDICSQAFRATQHNLRC